VSRGRTRSWATCSASRPWPASRTQRRSRRFLCDGAPPHAPVAGPRPRSRTRASPRAIGAPALALHPAPSLPLCTLHPRSRSAPCTLAPARALPCAAASLC